MADDPRRVHLDVALDLDGEAIRGSVGDGVAAPVEFAGWLELMSAFEIARAKAQACRRQTSVSARRGT